MATLETVVCITPNKLHSMHDQNITRQADQWLQSNFSNLIEWCRTHNSIFVIDYDEGTSKSNKIALMLLGAHVRSNFKLSTPYNHYSVTKSIANAYGADSTYNANLVNATSITGCFF
jgi:acid phosphatase